MRERRKEGDEGKGKGLRKGGISPKEITPKLASNSM